MNKKQHQADFRKLSETRRREKILYSNLTDGIAAKLVELVNEKTDNKEKVKILNEIIDNKGFEIKERNAETKSIIKVFETVKETDKEYGENMNGARALNSIGYDVYMLPRHTKSKSFDYILVKGKQIYTAELKTIYGENSVDHRLEKAIQQSNRLVLNIVGNASSRYVADEIQDFYLKNPHIQEVIVLLGGKPIYVKYGQVKDKKFTKSFMDRWAR